jgi:DNA-binding MarR family transcriptional regulator
VLCYSDAPIKPSAAATLLFQETQSITGILHRIEARGWVQRTPDPNDRRAVGITLTASGHKLTAEIVEISEELYAELFASALTAADKRQIERAPQEGSRCRLQASGDGLQAPPRAAVSHLERLSRAGGLNPGRARPFHCEVAEPPSSLRPVGGCRLTVAEP